MHRYKPYKKDFDYSYTLGVFLTIELLQVKADQVIGVIISSNADKNSGLAKITELCHLNHITMDVDDKVISLLSPKENCYAIGVFIKYNEDLEACENHVVLVNPMDSGNLGTIIRPAVDIFEPKTIRASMGSIFHCKFVNYNCFEDYRSHFENYSLYPFLLHGEKTVDQVSTFGKEPYSLIFGNESSGLSEYYRHIGTSIVIPHSKRIDSLNLSIAAGIAFYEFSKDLVQF